MATTTEPIPNNKTLISWAIAAITRGASPPIMKNMPPIIASIATIVTRVVDIWLNYFPHYIMVQLILMNKTMLTKLILCYH
jgi:hypothetical protein